MAYLITCFIALTVILLFKIFKRTAVRRFFEHRYESALRKRQLKKAEKWGRLYYGSFTSMERKEDGIGDINTVVDSEISKYAV